MSRLQEAERLLAKLADECDDLKVTRYPGARHDPDCTVCAAVAEARAFLAASSEDEELVRAKAALAEEIRQAYTDGHFLYFEAADPSHVSWPARYDAALEAYKSRQGGQG